MHASGAGRAQIHGACARIQAACARIDGGRELIRAFQFAYTRVRPAETEPESCEVVGLLRLQPRADCPREAIDHVAGNVLQDEWMRVREEAIRRLGAAES